MGVVSDAFDLKRHQLHVARPLRGVGKPKREWRPGPPTLFHPSSQLWKAAKDVSAMRMREVKQFYHRLGKMSRPEIAAGIERFRQIGKESNVG